MQKLQKLCSKKQSDTDPTWPTLTTTCKCVPDVTSAELTTNFVSRGILLQNSGRLSEAALSYQSAIKFRPKLAVAYLNLGVTYSDLGRKDEAIKILQQGSQLDDNGLKDPKANANARISAMFHLGKLLLEAGEVKRAISVLLNAVKQGGQENILNLLGESYQAIGQVDEAEQWYSKSLQANPTHIPAHLTLAKMLAKNVSF
jgi:tetratricopeptide (TPR) repeat protein